MASGFKAVTFLGITPLMLKFVFLQESFPYFAYSSLFKTPVCGLTYTWILSSCLSFLAVTIQLLYSSFVYYAVFLIQYLHRTPLRYYTHYCCYSCW